MLRLIRHSIARLWDAFRNGPDVRRLTRRVRKLEAASKDARARWEREHAALKHANSLRYRNILSPDTVRDLLPIRVETVRVRASQPHATAAEARLLQASASYDDALARFQRPADGLVRTEVQGLSWWVPVRSSLTGAARDRFLAKQRFPYRNITQTRELALGPIMLDIGANIGRMSIPRVILGDFAQAYCAEPDPLNYAALVRNIADNGLRGLVLPDRAALGATTGTARLRHAKYSGGHRLVVDGDPGGAIDVPCWRLDDWCKRLTIDPELVSYVKVDTQGWECDVLRGAPELLTFRHIAWQLEISPEMLAEAGASPAELYDLCAERFSHFIDLGKTATGPRARPTAELATALGYVQGKDLQTDIILFNAAA